MDSVEDVVERMKRINKDEIQGAAVPQLLYCS
jgi:hypothetical protein